MPLLFWCLFIYFFILNRQHWVSGTLPSLKSLDEADCQCPHSASYSTTVRTQGYCPRGIFAWPTQITSNKPSPTRDSGPKSKAYKMPVI
jgi:hypothetical protein